ncbi:uncharacterized protein LOC117378370 [Periophthalmus magnuspinnatus]|uniref:uncharacterized protein LOC117378370 n=1 Tax=Periophthalmus magnuspinnatus TaxID=409849 RepID=UPI002437446E|nr:uncharacterized protein LOC117378370 [Periophthalmus magnuspinnatus]
MRLFVSLVLILALSRTRADPSPNLESRPETEAEAGPETKPETNPEPGSEECRRLNTRMSLEDKSPVLGRFHFLLGFANHSLYRTILNMTSSVWVNVTETQTGIALNQFNKMNGTCVRSAANATINGDMVKVVMYNITSEFQFLTLSETSMVLDIKAFSPDVRDFAQKLHIDHTHFGPELRVRSFYLMSRRPDVSDKDLQLFRVHAYCEGFKEEPHYSHNKHEYCSEEESIVF